MNRNKEINRSIIHIYICIYSLSGLGTSTTQAAPESQKGERGEGRKGKKAGWGRGSVARTHCHGPPTQAGTWSTAHAPPGRGEKVRGNKGGRKA